MSQEERRVRIVTACSQGLCRSVGLADVLKLHFEPVDVIPIGVRGNSKETLSMLGNWCDYLIVMESRYADRIPQDVPRAKIIVCEVGRDTYGNSHNPQLIDKVWQWTRRNGWLMGIKEHNKRL